MTNIWGSNVSNLCPMSINIFQLLRWTPPVECTTHSQQHLDLVYSSHYRTSQYCIAVFHYKLSQLVCHCITLPQYRYSPSLLCQLSYSMKVPRRCTDNINNQQHCDCWNRWFKCCHFLLKMDCSCHCSLMIASNKNSRPSQFLPAQCGKHTEPVDQTVIFKGINQSHC